MATVTRLEEFLTTQEFFLLSASNSTLAIQAGATPGDGVTLQPLDEASGLQRWTIAMQLAGGYLGVAFINVQTQNAVTYNGNFAQLVMQSYSPNSTDRDSWLIFDTGTPSACRIVDPADTSFSWNDLTGAVQPGDAIGLWNDKAANSMWTVKLPNNGNME
jgi:hypothetical protein